MCEREAWRALPTKEKVEYIALGVLMMAAVFIWSFVVA